MCSTSQWATCDSLCLCYRCAITHAARLATFTPCRLQSVQPLLGRAVHSAPLIMSQSATDKKGTRCPTVLPNHVSKSVMCVGMSPQAATDKGSKAVLASQPNADGNTPLHMAILVMGQMVLAPEPGDDDRVGGTPGMPSCMLIEDGCFIDIPNAKGQTAVSLAVECAARAMAAGRDVSACTEVLLTLSKGSTSASGNAALALFDQPSHPVSKHDTIVLIVLIQV